MNDTGPQFKFLNALLGDPAESAPEPEYDREATREALTNIADLIQDFTATAVGVRARAVEGGISAEMADQMAAGTFVQLLMAATGGAHA